MQRDNYDARTVHKRITGIAVALADHKVEILFYQAGREDDMIMLDDFPVVGSRSDQNLGCCYYCGQWR